MPQNVVMGFNYKQSVNQSRQNIMWILIFSVSLGSYI